MNPILKTFYDNENQREAVREFIFECLNELAIKRVMARESTLSLADAKEVVEQSFIRLREIYGEKPKPNISSSR
jgi:hypothetical protein